MTSERTEEAEGQPARLPGRIVAIGGGTGLPAVLRGLKRVVQAAESSTLTAIVAMSDDGGSSGRLRRTHGLPPPGDLRNCLVALAKEESLLSGLFQHRYAGETDIGGHSLGNLILVALAEQTGSLLKAVEVSSRVLRIVGGILPVTLEDVRLEATLADGTRLVGESVIGVCERRIKRIRLLPETAKPTDGVVASILEADLVVLGPGSLFTSLLPNLVLPEVGQALRSTRAVRVLVGNLVSESGEEQGLGLKDHIETIEAHVGGRVVDALLVHDGPIDPQALARYRAEGAEPLKASDDAVGVRVIRRPLLASERKLRHDPLATAAGLVEAWSALEATGVAESEG